MSESPLGRSAYEIIGAAPTADDEALRRAYRAALRSAHPDTGGSAEAFTRVQRAWESIGTPEARARYDRGGGSAAYAPRTAREATGSTPRSTRPMARSHGHPGGWHRERFLTLMTEWVGRGAPVPNLYDEALVRSAPAEIREQLAQALAEEYAAREFAALGMGYTIWHDVAVGDRKIDHVVLGPPGLLAVNSIAFDGEAGFTRSELLIAGRGIGAEKPIKQLATDTRTLARAARVRFDAVGILVPDTAMTSPARWLASARGMAAVVARRDYVGAVLRQGVPGVPPIGGAEIFEVRTRLSSVISYR